jgi:NADH:ubiquinone oxidoreductase subunit 6 (subunit J)
MELMAVAWAYWHQFFFIIFAGSAVGFGCGVLISQNIVRMAFYLVLSLGSTAGLFFLAGAEFVGAMQLMIYVGGTMVLLIFGVMLTAQKDFVNMKTHTHDWILATVVGGSLLMVLLRFTCSWCSSEQLIWLVRKSYHTQPDCVVVALDCQFSRWKKKTKFLKKKNMLSCEKISGQQIHLIQMATAQTTQTIQTRIRLLAA